MGYHPRIEADGVTSFCTTRTRNSELWFIKNKRLQDTVLGNLAKRQKRYEAKLYAFALSGSHSHELLEVRNGNRASFMRDVNSQVAKAVERECPEYPGGHLWGRRYSCEYMWDNRTIEEYFFYIVLQPVQDGLVERISDYPGYNCFHDAINGIKRCFEVVNWTEYNERKRWDANVRIKDHTEIFELQYARLPGYEHLSPAEYKKYMLGELERRRQELVAKRRAEGKGFVGRGKLLRQRPGTRARNPKTSTRTSHRPRVLSVFNEVRAAARAWYFAIYFEYKRCSAEYRSGKRDTEFPPGTYKPPLFTVKRPVDLTELC